MIYQILKEAWISIGAYKLRTFLTMLGILIGVAAVVLIAVVGVILGVTFIKPNKKRYYSYLFTILSFNSFGAYFIHFFL